MTEAAVRRAFRDQATACRMLGSDFTAGICDMLARVLQPDQGPVAEQVLGWRGDPSGKADSVPLRLCGGLHALVLTGLSPDLVRAYTNREIGPALLIDAIQRHRCFLHEWLQSPPQTNEVARSAAIIAAARFIQQFTTLPMRALELGSSAGLNLNFHRCDIDIDNKYPEEHDGVILRPKWSGEIPLADLSVATARGIDLNPLNPVTHALRLRSYCWPDQKDRLARLDAALTLAQQHPTTVDQGDAGAWLKAQLDHATLGQTTFVFHTIAAQYFPRDTLTTCEAALQNAGRAASRGAPLIHFSMESDGGDGARLSLRLWDGAERAWILGRADFHGRWITWQPKEIPPQDVNLLALGHSPK
ncbi:DUF2332 family protein [Paracoccus sp. 11-3]|uniref:DUF2332 family protein n=1 Tax=Paracoccus amoyensis TaxID=2760093 RepID=A0A926GB92_9RHOB|nr:DUF2332 family protein [Paracoccus amoyensis]MBC9245880.1 DUF2332 family protein [Paracoccus amoyensis]